MPNVAAQSLRGGRTSLIGVYTFEPVFPVSADDYYHEFLVGIEEQAVEARLDLVLFASTQSPDGRRSIYASGSNRLRLADGAVLLGLQDTDQELERLAAEEFPVVFIGRREGVVGKMPYVSLDYDGALAGVLEQLHAVGHRQIGYLGDAERTGPDEERLHGYLRHSERLNVRAGEPVLVDAEQFDPALVTALIADGVTAMVVESYALIDALTEACTAAGLSIPADLSIVGLDVGRHRAMAPRGSHIELPRRALGRRAVAVLIELLEGRVDREYHEELACLPADDSTIAPPAS